MGISKVIYLDFVPEEIHEIIRAHMPEEFELVTVDANNDAERIKKVKDVDFIMLAGAKVNRELLLAAPKLKMIQHQGVGYDNTDVKSATELGIPVCITPEGTTVGVAEHTILLILALYKKLVTAHQAMLEGRFLQWELRGGSFEISGKTVGLIGFGRIAREVAKRLNAFGADIMFFDKYINMTEEEQKALQVTQMHSMEEMLSRADIVSLHIPFSEENRGMFNGEVIEMMKPNAVLINTARGILVDEPALIEALKNKRIAGAGLDVFAKEPLPKDSPLLALDNVVLTPHIAGGTADAQIKRVKAIFSNMKRMLNGEDPINSINLKDIKNKKG